MTEQKNELERNAVAEARTKEQRSCQRTVDMKDIDSRTDDSRMTSQLAGIDQEAAREALFNLKSDQVAWMNKEERIQLNLVKKFNKRWRKQEKAAWQGFKQKEWPEIQQMNRNINAAITKHQQYVQLYKVKHEEKDQDDQYKELMKKMFDEQRNDVAQTKEMLQRKQAYKEFLVQLTDKEAKQRAQYEDKLQGAVAMHDIVKGMTEATIRDQEGRKERRKKMRLEKLAHMSSVQELAQKKKELLKAEELARQKEVEKQEKEKKERTSKNDANRRKREQNNQIIAQKITHLKKEKEKHEDLIRELQEQEELERQYCRERHDKDRAETAKTDMRQALLSQMDDNAKTKHKERERERDLRKGMDAKVKEDEQKEKSKQEKVKETKKQYAEDLTQQIQQNKERKAKDKEAEAKRAEKARELQNNTTREVERESDEMILRTVSQTLGSMHRTLRECRRLPLYRELHHLNHRHSHKH